MYVNNLPNNSATSLQFLAPSSTPAGSMSEQIARTKPGQCGMTPTAEVQNPINQLISGILQVVTSLVSLVSGLLGGGANQAPATTATPGELQFAQQPSAEKTESGTGTGFFDQLKSFGSDLLGEGLKDWFGKVTDGAKGSGIGGTLSSIGTSIGSFFRGLF